MCHGGGGNFCLKRITFEVQHVFCKVVLGFAFSTSLVTVLTNVQPT